MSASIYRYSARTDDGRRIRGTIEASDADAVLLALRTRALFVTAIERESALVATASRAVSLGVPRRSALLAFFRAFATLIRAGVPMRRALDVTIERTTDAGLCESLQAVAADIEHGSSLGDALARRPRTFRPLYVAMIRAGETGGILDDVLERLATFLEREAELRKKVRSALAYPLVVLTAASGLIFFLITRVVPMFAQMFAAFHVEPPPVTKTLLLVASALGDPAKLCVLGASIAAVTAAIVTAGRTPRGALALDRLRLRVPIFGPLLKKAIVARIARMLATLLRSGIELTTAIDVVRPVTGSRTYADALSGVSDALRQGDALSGPVATSHAFDPLVVALIRVGEETGLVDEMLFKIAGYFETDVEAAIATLSAAIEPALIAALGLVVGFIVFSIFIPLYSLIGSVTK
jgi:type IV pilus assembly protein PilC